MLKAYKYKIKPDKEQQEQLNKFFGCTRFVYNWGLETRTSAYKNSGQTVNYKDLSRELVNIKKQQEFEWLSECPGVSLQQSLRNLDKAFTAFFRQKADYPTFKSKKGSKDSVKFIDCVHFDFEGWTVKLPKIGKVKLCKNRTFNQSVCKQGTCTVSRDRCGTYWCTINVNDGKKKPTKAKLDKGTSVGIDLGIKDYAILSDGTKFTSPKHLEKAQKKLAHLQRVFDRTQNGSKNHERMRVKVAKCYRIITNRRNDFIHKLRQ